MKKYDPIIICGAHGGGTSYITKLLRWSGLFVGSDSGSKFDRKCHESDSYLQTNVRTMARFFGDNTMMYNAPWKRYFADISNKDYVNKICNSIDTEKIYEKFAENNPEFKKNPWGWKDPRNSVMLPVWSKKYPKAKLILIDKDKSQANPPKSPSGKWYHQVDKKIIEYYTRPIFYENHEHKIVQFEKLISDFEYFNDLLLFCGLNTTTKENFEKLLLETKLEK